MHCEDKRERIWEPLVGLLARTRPLGPHQRTRRSFVLLRMCRGGYARLARRRGRRRADDRPLSVSFISVCIAVRPSAVALRRSRSRRRLRPHRLVFFRFRQYRRYGRARRACCWSSGCSRRGVTRATGRTDFRLAALVDLEVSAKIGLRKRKRKRISVSFFVSGGDNRSVIARSRTSSRRRKNSPGLRRPDRTRDR